MEKPEIISPSDLKTWLLGKPSAWAALIAARIALRVLPAIGRADESWLANHALGTFRATNIAWAVSHFRLRDINEAAIFVAANAINFPRSHSHGSELAVDAAFAAAASSLASFNTDIRLSNEEIINYAVACFSVASASMKMESSTSDDAAWLLENKNFAYFADTLAHESVWMNGIPISRRDEWLKLKQKLVDIDPSYSVWVDWYERRLRGAQSAFDIPGDERGIEDQKILRRLAKATDEDFWGKGHEYINTTLKGWLDEARARAALQPEAETELETPPQEGEATAYGVNAEGQVDRLPHSDQARLRDEPDQRRAYVDVRDAAIELREEGQRLGPRLLPRMARFVESMPEKFDEAEAWPLWRDGNALRRLHRAHQSVAKSSDPDAAKLDPVVAEGLAGLLDLFNNFAFGDPGLRAKDQQSIPPQEQSDDETLAAASVPVLAAIAATPEIATEAARNDVLAIVADAELPADDPYRAQVLAQSNKTGKNFVAGVLAWVGKTLLSPRKVGVAVASGAVAGAAGVVGRTAMTVIVGAEYATLLEFIATNAVVLQNYVSVAFSSYPHLPELIERTRIAWLNALPK